MTLERKSNLTEIERYIVFHMASREALNPKEFTQQEIHVITHRAMSALGITLSEDERNIIKKGIYQTLQDSLKKLEEQMIS